MLYPRGQFGNRGIGRRDGDHPAVVGVVLGEGECRVLQPEFRCMGERPDGHNRDNEWCSVDVGDRLRHVEDAQRHTEYFFTSSFLYNLPVSVRGSCASNEIDRGHL